MTSVLVRPEWIQEAERFAKKSLASRKRKIASRGQTSEKKVLQDITSGTVAEFAIAEYLRSINPKCGVSVPDTAVYEARDKSWLPDLYCETGERIHVKTFTNPRWSSWVFTCNPGRNDIDPLIIAPKDEDILALTQVTETHVVLHFLVKAVDVRNLYKPPLLPQLQYSKVVLYPDDLATVRPYTVS